MLKNSPLLASKIYETRSPLNGHIVVYQQGTRRRLTIGHCNYSLYSSDENDLFEDRYWGKITAYIKSCLPQAEKALILGLSGGTMAYLLARFFPGIQIDGVEFDSKMIDVGQKYFYLSRVPRLNIIGEDAYHWVFEKRKENTYEVIIVDIYQGIEIPSKFETARFFSNIKKLLKPKGILAINRISSRVDADKFLNLYLKEKLEPNFDKIEVEKLKGAMDLDNLLIYAR